MAWGLTEVTECGTCRKIRPALYYCNQCSHIPSKLGGRQSVSRTIRQHVTLAKADY